MTTILDAKTLKEILNREEEPRKKTTRDKLGDMVTRITIFAIDSKLPQGITLEDFDRSIKLQTTKLLDPFLTFKVQLADEALEMIEELILSELTDRQFLSVREFQKAFNAITSNIVSKISQHYRKKLNS